MSDVCKPNLVKIPPEVVRHACAPFPTFASIPNAKGESLCSLVIIDSIPRQEKGMYPCPVSCPRLGGRRITFGKTASREASSKRSKSSIPSTRNSLMASSCAAIEGWEVSRNTPLAVSISRFFREIHELSLALRAGVCQSCSGTRATPKARSTDPKVSCPATLELAHASATRCSTAENNLPWPALDPVG